jgi:hypothetical protein
MTNKELIKQIRSLRGNLFVPVNSKHDTYFVKVVKNDLISTLDPNGEAVFSIDTQREQPTMHYLEQI